MAAVPTTSEEIRVYWNEFSESYERNFVRTTMLINSIIIPLLNMSSSHTIIECGCGTGTGIELILQENPNISKILANDFSESMVEKARGKNLKNTEIILASSESLPYESSICDRYISNLSIHLVENPSNAMNEAYRVLKPGGIAVLSVWGKSHQDNFFCIAKKCLQSAGAKIAEERNQFHLNDQFTFNNLAKEAGFVNVRSFYSSVPVLVNNVEELVFTACDRPEHYELKKNEPEVFDRFVENCRIEFRRIWDSGYMPSFDFLVLIAEKV